MNPEMRLMTALSEHVDSTSSTYAAVLTVATRYAREVVARAFTEMSEQIQAAVREIEEAA